MTDDEIVTLGSFRETLMGYDAWRVLVERYEQQIFQHVMTTERGGGRSVRASTRP